MIDLKKVYVVGLDPLIKEISPLYLVSIHDAMVVCQRRNHYFTIVQLYLLSGEKRWEMYN